ncbi:nicotinamide N-methyltransferase-like protein, partial [Lipomyces arxii]|uniref:nicotinamide N-methyltransferase-like protein n=1 Tax=Lipomyces arxii TaxID=56418 RepID=UPI0034CD6142
ESRNVISGKGTTGYRTWEAAFSLSEYLIQYPDTVLGKRVLELGTGTGFVSLVVGKLDCAANITATDGFEEVLLYMRRAVHSNNLENSIQTRILKWGLEAEYTYTDPVDIILGADLTFDPAACTLLADTLNLLMRLNPTCKVLISAAIRDIAT